MPTQASRGTKAKPAAHLQTEIANSVGLWTRILQCI